MSSKTKIVVFKAKELIYTGIFILLGILLILLLIFMFAPSKESTEKSEQTSGYIEGVYSSPLTLGDSELELQVTVKNGKPQSAALKHLDKTVKTMYPLVEPSLKEINKQLPKVESIDDIKFDDQSQYTNTILKQAIKNALKKAQK
ncbi:MULTISPECIES: hypothetical protein [Anaerostipes]|uniref:Uncharacterized protein n=1 Tax=Anaerostipes butyraticus TaxID=645466 RepID=A0A916Q5J9_9FIRM|nr:MULTISPECIES: hypothetical protein [Anaerostipes]GFO84692.1 hypothetical protein ANBU17_10390 [Anaerostipes butyraticus]HJC83711.1 hypothetical protein [Candidatus Anaerostipes avicola]